MRTMEGTSLPRGHLMPITMPRRRTQALVAMRMVLSLVQCSCKPPCLPQFAFRRIANVFLFEIFQPTLVLSGAGIILDYLYYL